MSNTEYIKGFNSIKGLCEDGYITATAAKVDFGGTKDTSNVSSYDGRKYTLYNVGTNYNGKKRTIMLPMLDMEKREVQEMEVKKKGQPKKVIAQNWDDEDGDEPAKIAPLLELMRDAVCKEHGVNPKEYPVKFRTSNKNVFFELPMLQAGEVFDFDEWGNQPGVKYFKVKSATLAEPTENSASNEKYVNFAFQLGKYSSESKPKKRKFSNAPTDKSKEKKTKVDSSDEVSVTSK